MYMFNYAHVTNSIGTKVHIYKLAAAVSGAILISYGTVRFEVHLICICMHKLVYSLLLLLLIQTGLEINIR